MCCLSWILGRLPWCIKVVYGVCGKHTRHWVGQGGAVCGNLCWGRGAWNSCWGTLCWASSYGGWNSNMLLVANSQCLVFSRALWSRAAYLSGCPPCVVAVVIEDSTRSGLQWPCCEIPIPVVAGIAMLCVTGMFRAALEPRKMIGFMWKCILSPWWMLENDTLFPVDRRGQNYSRNISACLDHCTDGWLWAVLGDLPWSLIWSDHAFTCLRSQYHKTFGSQKRETSASKHLRRFSQWCLYFQPKKFQGVFLRAVV